MKLIDIKNPITLLSGIGNATAKLFAKLNIFSVADLLTFYPKDYEDRTKKIPLSHFRLSKVHCVAKVIAHEWFGYGRMKTLKLIINDNSATAELVAFNRPFLENQFPVGSIICVSGTFELKYNKLQSTSFDITKLSNSGNIEQYDNSILPDSFVFAIYPLTEGLNQKIVRKAIANAIREYSAGIDNELPLEVMQKYNLLEKKIAIQNIHLPENIAQAEKARSTLIYEELFFFQCSIAKRAWEHKGEIPKSVINIQQDYIENKSSKEIFEEIQNRFILSLSPLQKNLYERLSFSLTEDQMKVIMEMDEDIDRGYRERELLINNKLQNTNKPIFTMARLLQGDVGSGKTLVAFFVCLRAISWKGQCAFMAPTELLARQHAESASKLLEMIGVRVAFLTGNIKSKQRAQLLKQLKEGNIDIVIGTHALFSSGVQYNDLQLAVIDEQHRFGVLQRQAIIEKGRKIEGFSSYTLQLLMMSATPIPQTLALTIFGDLDVSVIHSLPQGRKKIITYLVKEGNEINAYEAVRKQLEQGRQAYFVYPAIDAENQKSAEEAFETLAQKVYPQYKCALIHSKIDEEEQIQILHNFQNGKIQVLAATTVIEVGVDIPNASCIVIEGADRFGLAQLHQLRGRVGRGEYQSYCFLIYSKNITESGIERMKVLRESTDGFYIAEKDLKLRGPGEVTGIMQAGNLQLGIADIHRDYNILLKAREDAFNYMKKYLDV